MVNELTNAPLLPPDQKPFIQHVVGSLLYHALPVDCSLLIALGDLSSAQAQPTRDTLEKLTWLLNYVACNPNAEITYVAINMCLCIHSDASYLSAAKARSRAGAHIFLGDNPVRTTPTVYNLLTVPYTSSPKLSN